MGAPLGSGKHFIPWIHVDDLIGMFYQAVKSDMSGAYNAVAPAPVDNGEFTRILAKVLKKKLWLPNVPGFVLKTVLGERASLVLKGSRVSSDKIEGTGFKYQYPDLAPALKNLLSH